MKKILSLILLITALQVRAQMPAEKIDSLKQLLTQQKEDTLKVTLLNEISFQISANNPQEGFKYGNEALDLANKLKWNSGIALAHRMIGLSYHAKADFVNAISNYLKEIKILEALQDSFSLAATYNNISNVYRDQKSYKSAAKYLEMAIALNRKLKNEKWEANNLINMGNLFFAQADYQSAIGYYEQALMLAQKINFKYAISLTTSNIGAIYSSMEEYKKALPYLQSSLEMDRIRNDLEGMSRNYINIGTLYKMQYDANGKKPNERNDLLKAKAYADSALAIDKEIGDPEALSEDYNVLSEIESALGNYSTALEHYKQYASLQDSVYNIENDRKITQSLMQYDFDKKEAAAKAEQEKKDIRQKNIRNSIMAGLGGSLIFLAVVWRQRNKISKEKKRSEELLLNILPSETADELKRTGSAQAKNHNDVTVLFTDFKNFTQMGEQLSAQELVNEINFCYSAFDNIISKYGIEKIKTIGDSYMCAAGLPADNPHHAADTVNAALEIRDFIEQEKNKRKQENKPFFDIRIGCHSGAVVAGIVGIKKFAYDIWGDTVNIASRMESSGEAGKVNISETTYQLVKDQFNCTHRGKIEAKNKGTIDMYFVERG